MAKIKLNLCKGCREDLNEYNPYVDENGNTIPISEMDITIVEVESCINYEVDGEFVNMKKREE